MIRRCLLSSQLSLVLIAPLLLESAWAQEPSGDEQADRKARFAYLHEQVNSFELRFAKDADRELKPTAEPVLRYTNPVRSADGVAASYLWLDGNRPVAAICISIRQEDKVWRELVSLTAEPLNVSKAGAAIWTPTSEAQAPHAFLEAPDPAESPAQRLIQMRSLAKRFSVRMFRDPPVDARLLPQPMYRYADPPANIQDAALFAFVETTDPEALLMLESRPIKKDGPPKWHYRFARMTSAGIEAHLAEERVFTVDSYWRNPRAKTDSYQEAQQIRYGAEPPTPNKPRGPLK